MALYLIIGFFSKLRCPVIHFNMARTKVNIPAYITPYRLPHEIGQVFGKRSQIYFVKFGTVNF